MPMSTKSSNEIILGVTGSIAAYKACEVASLLTKQGHTVVPVLTGAAQQMVGAASFEGITGQRAITSMFDSSTNAEIDHVALPTRASLVIVAPATANVLAKAAQGIADDWLTTALLVTRAPILFAPAMNTNMFQHPAVQANLRTLRERGCHFVGPDSGVLACKTIGLGRMIDPEYIVEVALGLLRRRNDFEGVHVLITSGANHEPIDPVRFIGNRSTGKMGYALAKEALDRGAKVTVVTGPADVAPPLAAHVIHANTAVDMRDAVLKHLPEADIVIGAAAIADYRIAEPLTEKHKKDGKGLTLRLVENPDVISEVALRKRDDQVIVGFAAETNDLIANAQAKLRKKHLDLIVANAVGGKDSAIGADAVRATILSAAGEAEALPLLPKSGIAERLFDRLAAMRAQSRSNAPTR
jgi:phosphopantothenoylcysteine decarboxylase/phosphopantothenate--cysteine ligase